MLPAPARVQPLGRGSSWAALPATEPDDGRDHPRKRCYIRTVATVSSVNLVAHTFEAQGYVNLFWEDAEFATRVKETQGLEVKCGSVATEGVYWAPIELRDDGELLPINPHNMFANQLSLEHPGPLKVVFNDKMGVVEVQLTFKAELTTFFDLHNFPFDRQILGLQINFRSGCFKLSPEPFQGVPDRWNLRSPVSIALAPSVSDQFALRASQPFVYDCRDWKPVVRIMCERNSTPWVLNFVLPTFIIVLCGGSAGFMPASDVSGRASMLVT
eukprot:COSAG03_NODE_5320_length_1276_cov_0.907392_2_plen_270_part_01